MFISFKKYFSYSIIMSTQENTQIILQYMRVVLRQQDTLINTINSIQQQSDNLYSLISDLLRQQGESPPPANIRRQPIMRPRRSNATRPRTRMFFSSPLSGLNERITRTPRIVTHHRNGNRSVNIPGSVNQTTTTEDIINESFNNYTPISIRPS